MKKNKKLQGKVLVPKIGQRDQLIEALQAASNINHGMGWGGTAKLIVQLKLDKILKIKGNKRQRKKKTKKCLQQTFMDAIMVHGDWVSLEESF